MELKQARFATSQPWLARGRRAGRKQNAHRV
jgi:hypothetical protein